MSNEAHQSEQPSPASPASPASPQWLEPATEYQRAVYDTAWGTSARSAPQMPPLEVSESGWPTTPGAKRPSGPTSGLVRVRRRSETLSVSLARWREGMVTPLRLRHQDRRTRLLTVTALILVALILFTVVGGAALLTEQASAPLVARLPFSPLVPRHPPTLSGASGSGATGASGVPGDSETPTANLTSGAAGTPTVIATATSDPSAGLPPDPQLPAVFCADGVTTPTPLPTGQGTCAPCTNGYLWTTQRWTEQQTDQALKQAATTYGVPVRLLYALASDESGRREWVVSCSGDAGLLQIKIIQWRALAIQVVPACGLSATTDSPWTLQGNANLGAKLVAWYRCYYGYAGDTGGILSAPGAYTVAWYYQQARLGWPSTLCLAVYHDSKQPAYVDLQLPTTEAERLACPYSAKVGDATYLEVIISAYDEGFGTMSADGITNWRYVNDIIWNLEYNEPATW